MQTQCKWPGATRQVGEIDAICRCRMSGDVVGHDCTVVRPMRQASPVLTVYIGRKVS